MFLGRTPSVSKCQNVGRGRAPLCQISKKKVVACVNVYRPTLRVKISTRGRAPLCQIVQKKSSSVSNFGAPRVGHTCTTTGLSHSPRALVVLGCGWGAADRPWARAARMCIRAKKTDPFPFVKLFKALRARFTDYYYANGADRSARAGARSICFCVNSLCVI